MTKRNGSVEEFDSGKIARAIERAFDEVDGRSLENDKEASVITDVIAQLDFSDDVGVEDIQDAVEDVLMAYGYYDVAKAYIRYRYLHELQRQSKNDEEFYCSIGDKLMARNVQNQNANVDERSFGGRIGEASDELMRRYALEHCLSPMARDNHLNNEIYIHDLNHYAIGDHNCLSIPFDKLLANGFTTRQMDIRPAQSVNSAFQLVAVIFQLQSLCQFGGVSATHIDWTMVPYVRKSFSKHFADGMLWTEDSISYLAYARDKKDGKWPDDMSIEDDRYLSHKSASDYAMAMTRKETRQAIEGMYHNLNTLQSRSGCQLPFTSINYGTCTLAEGRMVIKYLLDVSIEGLGKLHRTSIFPCGIFQCMKGVNRAPEDPNYDMFLLALKSTSQRLYPNYANVDWSTNVGYDRNDPKTYTATMGCRTYNGFDINGFGQLKDGRGNICPVTIIMPTIAMEAKEKANSTDEDVVETFIDMLDDKIHEAKDMLIERFDYICSQSPASAKFMYENGVMEGYVPEEGIRSALKHGTLALGQIGLAETLQILVGCDHTDVVGMELAKRIEQLFKDRCGEFKHEYMLNFAPYFSPAENLCYTSMKKFQDRYGIIENVSDHDFFTNSIHVPVWHHLTAMEKIDVESQLTGYSGAGCITYVDLESSVKHNIKALEKIVSYAMDKDIPYFAINVPNDTCLECGYQDEFNDTCPMCGSHHIQQLRRVTGYLTGDYKTAFNLGKQQEVECRFKHGDVSIDESEPPISKLTDAA